MATPDSGFVLTGSMWDDHDPNREIQDWFAIRADAAGNVIWSKAFTSVASMQVHDVVEQPASIAAAPTNGWLLGGFAYTDSLAAGFNIPYFVRLGLAGDTLWTRRLLCPTPPCYGQIRAVQSTPDSGFVAMGYTDPSLAQGLSTTIIAMGPQGDSLHALRYDYTDTVLGPRAIQGLPDGTHLCVIEGYRRLVLMRLDVNYQPLWCKTYSTDDRKAVFPRETRALPNGSVVIGGYIFDNPWTEAFLMQVDTAGDVAWAHTYHVGNLLDPMYAIENAPDGGWFLVGYSQDFHQGLLIKTDSLGNFDWARRYGYRVPGQTLYDVTAMPDGGLLLAGIDGPSPQSIFVARTDANYQVPCYDTTHTLFATADTFTIANLGVQVAPYAGHWASAPTVSRQYGNLETVCGNVGMAPEIKATHKLYPNPMALAGTLEVPTTLSLNGAELQLMDGLGHVVWRQSGIISSSVPVQVGGLAPGIYAYRLVQGAEVLATGRLVVAR